MKINVPSNTKLGTIIRTSHTIDVQLKRAAMKLKAGSPPFFTLTTNQKLFGIHLSTGSGGEADRSLALGVVRLVDLGVGVPKLDRNIPLQLILEPELLVFSIGDEIIKVLIKQNFLQNNRSKGQILDEERTE